MTVAKGFVLAVWTFGGNVPGPVIRVRVGDTIRVHLKNPATNKLPHSVDFHASQVAWNDEMTSINPGEEKLYEWKADYAGVWMYHCGTAPALHHIANGMYGMVIVEPAEGLPPVDHEFALVQSEWYLGPQGEPASLTKAAEAAPAPDFVVFNGVANQYLDNPIEVGHRATGCASSFSTPGRASTARSTSSARSSTPSSRKASTSRRATPATGAPRRSTSLLRRAPSSSSRCLKTASTRW